MAHQIIAIWAQVGMGSGPLLLIGWGLWQMNKAIAAGKRPLDLVSASGSAGRFRPITALVVRFRGRRLP